MEAFLESGQEKRELFSLFIVDELHQVSEHLLRRAVSTTLTFGFSATPGKKAKILGQKPIFSYSTLDAVRDGFLCPWIIDSLNVQYNEENLDNFIKELPAFLKKRPHPKGGYLHENRGIIWVPSIETADKVAGLLQKNGLKAGAVHTGNKGREAVLREFKKQSEAVHILVAVDMLKLGFDAKVDYAIMARKITELDSWLQMRGRILRGGMRFDEKIQKEPDTIIAPDKKIAYFIAFKGGLPEHDEHFFEDRDELVYSLEYLGGMEESDFDLQPYVDRKQGNREERPIEVHVADTDYSFYAFGITKAQFAERTAKEVDRGRARCRTFTKLFQDSCEHFGVTLGKDVSIRWKNKFIASGVLDETHLKMLSFLFNVTVKIRSPEIGNHALLRVIDGERLPDEPPRDELHVAELANHRFVRLLPKSEKAPPKIAPLEPTDDELLFNLLGVQEAILAEAPNSEEWLKKRLFSYSL